MLFTLFDMEKFFGTIKNEIRIIAWDDGPFKFKDKGSAVLIGVVFRGGSFIDGLIRTEVAIDGLDATEKIISSIEKTKHKDLRLVMLDGITFAGFNTVDIKKLFEKTKLPVVAINRKKPDLEKFKDGLKKLPHAAERLEAVKNAGEFYWADVAYGSKKSRVCFQCCGLSTDEAEQIIKLTTIRSAIPEPLRVAHLIATGIVFGESVGRA